MGRAFVAAAAFLGALAATSAASDRATAAPAAPSESAPRPIRLLDSPCAGCRAVFPAGTEPAPLLVVLHGDWGHGPGELVSSWERHALARSVGVLALACPKNLGCKGSYWQWNGDPAWITSMVDEVAKVRPVDRSRVWLAGWSGGASYMGLRAPELQRSFAALVYHGGGMSGGGACAARPAGDEAVDGGPSKRLPVYFLVGSQNPLHHLAVHLRQEHERCGDDVTWQLLPGADHAAEWRALDAHGDEIVTWLLRHAR